AGRAAAHLVGVGIRRGGRRNAPRRPQGSGLARTHPGLVLDAIQQGPAPRRPADTQRLGRAGHARAGLGVDGRLLVAAGLRRQPRAGRRRQVQVLRRRRAVDGRPRELRRADAGGDAVLARRRRHHRQPRVPLCEGREMKTFRNFAACLPLALLLCTAGAVATPKQAPLPRDSVYQLQATLTDQDGNSWDWRSKRGTPQVAAMFYTSCQYVCPLIVDSGKAVERALSADERAKLGILLISMDPARDDPEALMSVATKRKLDDT